MRPLKDDLLAYATQLEESAKRDRTHATYLRDSAVESDSNATSREQRAAEYRALAEKA